MDLRPVLPLREYSIGSIRLFLRKTPCTSDISKAYPPPQKVELFQLRLLRIGEGSVLQPNFSGILVRKSAAQKERMPMVHHHRMAPIAAQLEEHKMSIYEKIKEQIQTDFHPLIAS
jgi:hypothetical protein